MRCQNLLQHHGLELAELVAMWEAQDRRCYRYPDCSRTLNDPRLDPENKARGQGKIVIDHDHQKCPKTFHSCKRCRRGLTCHNCNVKDLAITRRGLWTLPEDKELDRWLEFLGTDERDRLRDALDCFLQ